jgi:hypothetical protein
MLRDSWHLCGAAAALFGFAVTGEARFFGATLGPLVLLCLGTPAPRQLCFPIVETTHGNSSLRCSETRPVTRARRLAEVCRAGGEKKPDSRATVKRCATAAAMFGVNRPVGLSAEVTGQRVGRPCRCTLAPPMANAWNRGAEYSARPFREPWDERHRARKKPRPNVRAGSGSASGSSCAPKQPCPEVAVPPKQPCARVLLSRWTRRPTCARDHESPGDTGY